MHISNSSWEPFFNLETPTKVWNLAPVHAHLHARVLVPRLHVHHASIGRIFQLSGVTRGIGWFNITLIFASFHKSSQGASITKPAPLMTRFVLALSVGEVPT